MCLIYNLFEIKLILLKSDIIYYIEPYVLALWSALVGVSVFIVCTPTPTPFLQGGWGEGGLNTENFQKKGGGA